MWPFDDLAGEPDPIPWGHFDSVEVEHGPDARPVDVAILWGLGMEARAHHLARRLRIDTYPNRHVTVDKGDLDDAELRQVRERFAEVDG